LLTVLSERRSARDKILLVVPYIGNLSNFEQFSILTLSESNLVEVALILSNVDQVSTELSCKGNVRVYDIREVFNQSNNIISLDELFRYPYKLTDMKIFHKVLFNIDFRSYVGIGFCDIDCLYNPRTISDRLQSFFTSKANLLVGGDRGHLMIFGQEAYSLVLTVMLAARDVIKARSDVDIFLAKRHFALDEFLFLHPILTSLNKLGLITWESSIFRPILDLSYKSLNPNVGEACGKLRLVGDSLYDRSNISDLSYVHFQKRSISRLERPMDYFEKYCSVEKNGSIIFTSDDTLFSIRNAGAVQRIRYFFTKYFIPRIKSRYQSHGLMPRPYLKAKDVDNCLKMAGVYEN